MVEDLFVLYEQNLTFGKINYILLFDGNFYLWSKRFEEYKDFMNETGRIAPKHGEVHNGNKVGSWFFVQRHHKLKGMLSDEQIRLLLEFNPKFFDELPKGKQN